MTFPVLKQHTMKKAFIHPTEHFNHLVEQMEDDEYDLFHELKATHVQTGYRGRNFVVYQIDEGGLPVILDKWEMLDFEATDDSGASTEIRSHRTGDTLIVGHDPIRIPGLDVFVWMPLHGRHTWDVIPDNEGRPGEYSLGFNFCIKVRSRRHPLESGVHHCETGKFFFETFPTISDPF
jgi:hypothetical protein